MSALTSKIKREVKEKPRNIDNGQEVESGQALDMGRS
jgi:hypothetical protein